MLYVFMGVNCSGKSSVARELKILLIYKYTLVKIIYVWQKMNMTPGRFNEELKKASNNKELNSQSIVCVISEKNDVSKIECLDNAVTIRLQRIQKLLNQDLPKEWKDLYKTSRKDVRTAVIRLEKCECKLHVDTSTETLAEVVKVYDFTLKFCE